MGKREKQDKKPQSPAPPANYLMNRELTFKGSKFAAKSTDDDNISRAERTTAPSVHCQQGRVRET